MPLDNDNQEQATPDFLNMSDDELNNFDPSTLAFNSDTASDSTTEADKTKVVGNDDGTVEETEEDKAATAAAAAALDDEDNTDNGEGANNESGKTEGTEASKVDEVSGVDAAKGADGKDDKGQKAADPEAKDDANKNAPADKTADKSADADASNAQAIDYEAEYKKLMGTFKANGRDITPKNAEDARTLMQMGANYNKKMAGMKPSLRILKMLETNGLLDESKLGFLIDVSKHNPEAINQLIVDSKIDPLDLSATKASEYKPGTHTINDQEMELDAVLGELKDSPTYVRTMQVAGQDWDQASRSDIVNKPEILKIIDGHMQSGIFDIIKAEIDSERTFGRLKGLSDIQAYQKVGDLLHASGGFNHITSGSSQGNGKPAAAVVVVPPKPAEVVDDKLKDRRKAAGGNKTAAPNTGVPADFNPLQMSDADFAKFKI